MTTLSEVKHYMRSRRRASLGDVAMGLGTSPDVARHLLEMWEQKQKVRHLAGGAGCGKGASGGCACASASLLADIYEWVGEDERASHAS